MTVQAAPAQAPAGPTAAGAEPPPPPAAATGEPMPAGMTGLNMYCAKFRDKPDDKKRQQLKTMAKCMAQDCEQSMEEIGCVYVTPGLGGLCYTNPGQNWCSENPSSADCVKQERPEGLWQPVKDLAFTGKYKDEADKKANDGPTFSCTCAYKCAYQKSSNKLRCADGWKLIGASGSDFEIGTVYKRKALKIKPDQGKRDNCACLCGGGDKWFGR